MNINLYIISFICFLATSCTINEKEVYGTYTSPALENTIDTLILETNEVYHRKLYRKNDKSLLLEESGKWEFKSGEIWLDNFYLDYDYNHNEKRNFEAGRMGVQLIPISKSGTIEIDYGPYENTKYYYVKNN